MALVKELIGNPGPVGGETLGNPSDPNKRKRLAAKLVACDENTRGHRHGKGIQPSKEGEPQGPWNGHANELHIDSDRASETNTCQRRAPNMFMVLRQIFSHSQYHTYTLKLPSIIMMLFFMVCLRFDRRSILLSE